MSHFFIFLKTFFCSVLLSLCFFSFSKQTKLAFLEYQKQKQELKQKRKKSL